METNTVTPATHLIIRGARQHNLQGVDLDLPKNKLIVFTGLSGSGKSSMAFDTIYAEGQRRYVESLSSYARQFLGVMDKPDVDRIDGLSPAISIDQKAGSHNPRSTVGTVTEIYDYLRLLFARTGHPHCPNCSREIQTSDPQRITQQILDLCQNHSQMHLQKGVRLILLSPIIRHQKGQFKELLLNLRKQGYSSVRIDKRLFDLRNEINLVKSNFHDIEVVIDRLVVESKALRDDHHTQSETKNRLFNDVEAALKLSSGLCLVSIVTDASFSFPENPKQLEDHLFSEKFACPVCNLSLPEIQPRTFSFNSPEGACPECMGLGSKLAVEPKLLLATGLSLNEGAIIPLAGQFESDTWLARLIRTVATMHQINLQMPVKDLDQKHLRLLLRGTGNREYTVPGLNAQGRPTTWRTVYKGIIPEIQRRYQETTSEYIRHELSRYMVKQTCPLCQGTRLKKEVLSITIDQKSIADITTLSIDTTLDWMKQLPTKLTTTEQQIAAAILEEITSRLSFLTAVGLDYLSLSREAATLAGGEMQRIRLASQIGSRLTGILYVLDEPTIGLHERDNKRLIQTLKQLQQLGNTLIVVEHDREMMLAADHLIEFGPGAGKYGGQVIFQGPQHQILKDKTSLTGAYLSGRKTIRLPKNKLPPIVNRIKLLGARENNLQNIDLELPLGRLISVTGVSGSGKSTLVVTTLYESLARQLNRDHRQQPTQFDSIEIPPQVKRVSLIDQSPIGRTPRSNPATYTKSFDYIRQLFASTQEARIQGLTPGRFSFNVKGGRCEACQGEGQIKIEMQFMADLYVTCQTCQGTRYNSQTLEIQYKGKHIAQILDLTVDEAYDFFQTIPGLKQRLLTLKEVGLGYIQLGQPAPTLSGGEAQRIKLASELAKLSQGRTIYILDEPTTGLHFEDLQKLILVLRKLVDQGNTIVVIEHNLDLIKNCDWVIDLGPEGGHKGGQIIAQGTPGDIVNIKHSYTGQELKRHFI